MRSASIQAIRVLMGSLLRQRARQPGAWAVELGIPLAVVLWACLGGQDAVAFATAVLAIGLPAGLLVSSAWEFGVLVEEGFWKRSRLSPAGGAVVFGAVALSALVSSLGAAAAAYTVLLACGDAGGAGLPWAAVAVILPAPAYGAVGLAIYVVLRSSAASVTAAPFVQGLLALLAVLPSALADRLGSNPRRWAVVARLSPADLSMRLWRRALAPAGQNPGSAFGDLCLGLAAAVVGLAAVGLLLRLLQRREA